MKKSLETIHRKTGISRTTLEHLHTLSTFDPKTSSEANIQALQKLLVSMINNQRINRDLGMLQKFSEDMDLNTINILRKITYRTRHLEDIEADFDSIVRNFNRANKSSIPLRADQKITLKQYGILHDLAGLHEHLKTYDQKNLLRGNSQLEKLYEKTAQSAEIIRVLNDTFNQSYRHETGTLVFDDMQKKAHVIGKSLGFFEWLATFFITKFGHVAQGVNKNLLSHINPDYKRSGFDLRNYLYSETYKINLEHLIADDTKVLLKSHFGTGWLSFVEQKFSQIERNVHDFSQSNIAYHDANTQHAAVTMKTLQGGHMNFFKKNHTNSGVRERILGKHIWTEEAQQTPSRVLCSEFIGLTLIASFEELNNQLKDHLSRLNVTDIPKTLVKNPISQKEKLHLLTPERLLKVLEERGAVVRTYAPKAIHAYFDLEESPDLKNDDDQEETMFDLPDNS